jgi:hypothetical protein
MQTIIIRFLSFSSFKRYDYLLPEFNPVDAADADLPDEVALFLSFPGNPCQVMQKHVLESLAFGKGPMMVVAPHFTEPALHGQLKGLGKPRLRQIRLLTNASVETLSGRLLRQFRFFFFFFFSFFFLFHFVVMVDILFPVGFLCLIILCLSVRRDVRL